LSFYAYDRIQEFKARAKYGVTGVGVVEVGLGNIGYKHYTSENVLVKAFKCIWFIIKISQVTLYDEMEIIVKEKDKSDKFMLRRKESDS
jgi:hypothetical protein